MSLINRQKSVPSYNKDTRIAINSVAVLLLLTWNRYLSLISICAITNIIYFQKVFSHFSSEWMFVVTQVRWADVFKFCKAAVRRKIL